MVADERVAEIKKAATELIGTFRLAEMMPESERQAAVAKNLDETGFSWRSPEEYEAEIFLRTGLVKIDPGYFWQKAACTLIDAINKYERNRPAA